MIRLTVVQARAVRGHPEQIKHVAVQRQSYERNREVRISRARTHALANGERRREVEQGYRDRNREKRRESVRRSKRRPGYREAERLARRQGAPVDATAREYVLILVADPCSYCGATADQLDHIDAVRRGGDGDWTNLTAACGDCNRRKATKTLLSHLHVGLHR